MSQIIRLAVFSLGLMVLAPFLGIDATSEAAPRRDTPAIEARPVHGLTIGPGRKLWVFVFPARPEGKGKPPKDEEPPAEACVDDNNQLLGADLGFQLPGPVEFYINAGSIPVAGAEGAIRDSFAAWENAINVPESSVFTIHSTGGASGADSDCCFRSRTGPLSAALRLDISARTVKAHLTSVYNKLGVDSRAAAVAIAAQKGWL